MNEMSPDHDQVPQITVRVPGCTQELNMLRPEWDLLGGDVDGWQLGGWVDIDDLYEFRPLWDAEQVELTHPDAPPVLVSLRKLIHEPSERVAARAYLKLRAVDAPQPHPAWLIDGHAYAGRDAEGRM